MFFDLLKYDFTFAWIYNSNLYRYLSNFLDSKKEIKILEIGSYEGLTTCFLADEFLEHPSSFIVTIDPFLPDPTTVSQKGEETKKICLENIAKCKFPKKVIQKQITSDDFFLENKEIFDFIYIDGSHEINQWLKDIENSIKRTKKGSIIWIDDYLGFDKKYAKIIRDFIDEKGINYKILNDGYQLALEIL